MAPGGDDAFRAVLFLRFQRNALPDLAIDCGLVSGIPGTCI